MQTNGLDYKQAFNNFFFVPCCPKIKELLFFFFDNIFFVGSTIMCLIIKSIQLTECGLHVMIFLKMSKHILLMAALAKINHLILFCF